MLRPCRNVPRVVLAPALPALPGSQPHPIPLLSQNLHFQQDLPAASCAQNSLRSPASESEHFRTGAGREDLGKIFFSFLALPSACKNRIPQPEIEPMPSMVKEQSPNCWTIRVFPGKDLCFGVVLKKKFYLFLAMLGLCCAGFGSVAVPRASHCRGFSVAEHRL